MRLDKFICKSTFYTKPEALALIQSGGLRVNGDIVREARTQVHENNIVTLHGERLTARAFRYLLCNKKANTVCSNIDEAYPSLFNDIAIERSFELHVAGRLDADTTGLVLITDDGRWSFDIIRPSQRCEKTYRVGLSRPLPSDICARFQQGIQLQGEAALTLPAKLEIVKPKEVLLTIVEGKYHQVKRMFAAVGNRVISLHREQIGRVKLDVDAGQWRYLTQEEIDSFSHSCDR